MITGFDVITQNLQMSLENIILLAVLIGTLVFYAKDFTLGIVIDMFICGLCFLWFYHMGWNYAPALTLTLMFFVLISLSLYATQKQTTTGGFV